MDDDDDNLDTRHHNKFKSEREVGAVPKPAASSLSENDKLNVGLDELVKTGKIAVPEYDRNK